MKTNTTTTIKSNAPCRGSERRQANAGQRLAGRQRGGERWSRRETKIEVTTVLECVLLLLLRLLLDLLMVQLFIYRRTQIRLSESPASASLHVCLAGVHHPPVLTLKLDLK